MGRTIRLLASAALGGASLGAIFILPEAASAQPTGPSTCTHTVPNATCSAGDSLSSTTRNTGTYWNFIFDKIPTGVFYSTACSPTTTDHQTTTTNAPTTTDHQTTTTNAPTTTDHQTTTTNAPTTTDHQTTATNAPTTTGSNNQASNGSTTTSSVATTAGSNIQASGGSTTSQTTGITVPSTKTGAPWNSHGWMLTLAAIAMTGAVLVFPWKRRRSA